MGWLRCPTVRHKTKGEISGFIARGNPPTSAQRCGAAGPLMLTIVSLWRLLPDSKVAAFCEHLQHVQNLNQIRDLYHNEPKPISLHRSPHPPRSWPCLARRAAWMAEMPMTRWYWQEKASAALPLVRSAHFCFNFDYYIKDNKVVVHCAGTLAG